MKRFSIWIVEESKVQSLRMSELVVSVNDDRNAWDAIYVAREQFPELHIIGVSPIK